MSPRIRSWLDTHKPAASPRAQLLMAALTWTLIGCMLLTFGLVFAHPVDSFLSFALITAAVVVGVLKALFILDGTARRIIERIESRGEGKCGGGFLGVRMWCMALGFMAAGQVLRRGLVPRDKLALLYVAVGTGLLVATRLQWRAWSAHRHPHHEP